MNAAPTAYAAASRRRDAVAPWRRGAAAAEASEASEASAVTPCGPMRWSKWRDLRLGRPGSAFEEVELARPAEQRGLTEKSERRRRGVRGCWSGAAHGTHSAPSPLSSGGAQAWQRVAYGDSSPEDSSERLLHQVLGRRRVTHHHEGQPNHARPLLAIDVAEPLHGHVVRSVRHGDIIHRDNRHRRPPSGSRRRVFVRGGRARSTSVTRGCDREV